MSLQEIFYIFTIAFFISFWIIVVVVAVAMFLLYRRYQHWQASLVHNSLRYMAGTVPTLPFLLPLLKKGWDIWSKRNK
jgi:hypothetical protein